VRAAVFDRTGEPAEVLAVRDVPTPEPGRGEVRVRMLLCPVNPSDLLYVRGRYTVAARLPATPGLEGVGVVEASGGGLFGRFLVGKRVCVLNDARGNWAEQTVARARQCVPVPAHLSDEQAAGFFVNPATALALTRHVLRVPKGEWLLQTAAGSQVGRMVIRLGQRDGFHTLNVVRRREQADELKRLGADVVLVESDGPLAEQVGRHPPLVAKYALDAVGGDLGRQAVGALAAGGRLVVYGALSGEPIPLDPRALISAGCRVEGFWLGHWAKSRGVLRNLRLTRQIGRLIADGTLAQAVGETYPLERVADAVRAAEAPGKPGKVLLRIGHG
jgi:NADPH:quinone reductase-like Zn-dependent oxidoreductase